MNKRFLLLSTLLFSICFTQQLFAAFPIQDNPSETKAAIDKHQTTTVATEITKKSAKWKQKLAKKVIAKKADIGENKTAAIVFSVLIPFVGVAIFQDGITTDFWITLVLTILGFIPGIIYALSIVLKRY